jgi:hypothetical protein
MTSDCFIHCRVTSQTKALAQAAARNQGISESHLIKQLLETVLRIATPGESPSPDSLSQFRRHSRLSIRLAAEDRARLADRAQARGMASATYVSLLVRSHLNNSAPLPKAEYLALRQSILELSALGRTLNQIARAANLGKSPPPHNANFAAMLRVADGLRDHFKALIKANEASWKGHA